jgi:hypothetical protein
MHPGANNVHSRRNAEKASRDTLKMFEILEAGRINIKKPFSMGNGLKGY